MKFDYNYYRRLLLEISLVGVILGILCILGAILTAFFVKKLFKNDAVNNIWNKKIIKLIYVLFMTVFSLKTLMTPIGHLKYGIYLINEKPENALVVEGIIEEIETIRNPSEHVYKSIEIEGLEIKDVSECYAHLITISGKKYYFMIKGNLKVGDNVEIRYLPKSTIVLEVNIIETE